MFRSIVSTFSRSLHTSARALQASPVSATTAATHSGPSKRTGVIAVKKGMTAIWDQWGVRIPVTLLQLDNVYVTQAKTPETDGYYGVQVGAVPAKAHRAGKSLVAHCTKAGVPFPLREYAEFKVTPDALLAPGTQIAATHYEVGQFIDVTAKTVGKGFSGVMKRWGFGGQGATHGVSLTHRHPGATGACQDPGKVWKGKKMAGRHGGKQCTVLGLQIVKIDHEANVLYVKGSVPGHDEQFIKVRDAVKKWGKTAGPVPTAQEPKKGAEWLPKSGTDPYLRYEAQN
ncbi:50S ribosomal protein L3 [Catenaria anguillulae PL171]|uniref:Large ribosomal subunit protein uL3m n=1 Tax=Catenaria anguillulae PL171 TaxID=765915 RepID=A0A1Y2I2V7_9FUNG|nr:50S ribosomal protein L3 [Catenaria anguillulae PL171]